MSWYDKLKKKEEELPEELEGKSVEDIVTGLKKARELETTVTTLKAEREIEKTAVATLNDQFDLVKTKLADLEAKAKPQNPLQNEPPADWITEPERAFAQGVAPIAGLAIEGSVMTARLLAVQQLDNMDINSPEAAKSMDGRLFRAWESEILEQAKRYQKTQLISPDAWLGIYWFIKGKHSDELRSQDVRKKKYQFLEPAAPGAGAPLSEKKTGVEALTDQEKHVADKMGVKHEDYAKRKAAMQFVQ
jgi:hypothetical protein